MGTSDIHGKAYSLFASTFTNNKKIGLGIIAGVRLSQEHFKNIQYAYAYVDKYFNALGGVKNLDVLTREQLRDMTIKLAGECLDRRISYKCKGQKAYFSRTMSQYRKPLE